MKKLAYKNKGFLTAFLFVASFFVVTAFVTAQTFEIAEIALFFDSCKECVEIDRVSEKGSEYGYVINHGAWSEEHYWYGESKNEAQTSFTSDISR